MIFTREWIWAACGKHPAAKDYLQIGATHNLIFKALSNWVDSVYQRLNRPQNNLFCSWRFWMKAPKRNTLIFGLTRDSSDSLGRPYPFLIVGVGSLPKWEKHWAFLPILCEPFWQRMELLATGRYAEIRQLAMEMEGMKPPKADWNSYIESPSDRLALETSTPIEPVLQGLFRDEEIIFPLTMSTGFDPFALARQWHVSLAARMESSPNAVFMGGLPDQPSMAIFKKALSAPHFVKLWFGS